MAPKSRRRENLEFLVKHYGSQAAVAKLIHPDSPTQPMISQILRNPNFRYSRPRHTFSSAEVKNLEQKIGIPDGWMDRYPLRTAWPVVEQFQKLSTDARSAVNNILIFVDENSQ
jgi:hypothetical protein